MSELLAQKTITELMEPAYKKAEILNFAYAFENTNPLNGNKPNLDKVLVGKE